MPKLKVNQLRTKGTNTATIEFCPDGSPHEFSYQGGEAQHYRCIKCLSRITKDSLKEATDSA